MTGTAPLPRREITQRLTKSCSQQDRHRIAALHKERFPRDQKTITMHIVDAHGGFLPVPLQQLFPSGGSYLQNSWAAVFRRPFFLFRFWLREGG